MQSHPVSWESLATFVAAGHQSGLRPHTIMTYVSAVLAEEKMRSGEVPAALQHRLSRLYQGLANTTVEREGPELRGAVSARDVVLMASKLDQLENRTASMAAAVVFGFLFALRAATIAAATLDDIDIPHGRLVFLETTRKSRATRAVRHVEIDTTRCKPAAHLWSYFKRLKDKCKNAHQRTPAFEYLAGAGRREPERLSSAIKSVYASLQLPYTRALTSHAIRRGAAVSMHAVGVSLPRILSWGAWQSHDSYKPYIANRAWQAASLEDKWCFAHLTH